MARYQQHSNAVLNGHLLSAVYVKHRVAGALEDWLDFAIHEPILNFGDANMKMLTVKQLGAVAAGVWEGENGEGCIPNPIKITIPTGF